MFEVTADHIYAILFCTIRDRWPRTLLYLRSRYLIDTMISNAAPLPLKIIISLGIGLIVESLPFSISVGHASWQPLLVDLLLSNSYDISYWQTIANGIMFYSIVFASPEHLYHTLSRLLRSQNLVLHSKNHIHLCHWVLFPENKRCPVHYRPERVRVRRAPSDLQMPQVKKTVERITRRPIESSEDSLQSFLIRKPGFKSCLVLTMEVLTHGRHMCLHTLQKSKHHCQSFIHNGVPRLPLKWIPSSIFQQALLARANISCLFGKQRSYLSESIQSSAFANRRCLNSGSRAFRLTIGLINTFVSVFSSKILYIKGLRPQRSVQDLLETLQNKLLVAMTWMDPAIACDAIVRFASPYPGTSSEPISPSPYLPGAFHDENNGEAVGDTWDRQGTCTQCGAVFSDPSMFPNQAVNLGVYPTAGIANRHYSGNRRAPTSALGSLQCR